MSDRLAALLATLSAGQTVVTATRRLARRITRVHDARQRARGRTAWRPLDVIPWDAWLARSWRRLREQDGLARSAVVLSADQERLLWEYAVSGLDVAGAILSPTQVAREAEEAWSLLQNYLLTDETLRADADADTRHFLRAAARFSDRCRDEGWTTRAELSGRLSESAPAVARLYPGIVLLGFDALPPAAEALLGALDANGCQVARPDMPAASGRVQTAALASPEMEIRAAAVSAGQWAGRDPDRNVGVVFLDLERRRALVDDVFDEVLTPGNIVPGSGESARSYDVSLGEPLSEWPIVHTAILTLQAWLEPRPVTDVGRLLRSPFLGGGLSERSERAGLDAWLRDNDFYELDLAALHVLLTQGRGSGRPACTRLTERLQAALETSAERPSRQSMDLWVSECTTFLAALGWPGDRTLDSAEYQTVAKWQEVLDRTASLGTLAGPVDRRGCVDRLRQIARETLFQPEGRAAQIQVMGLLEASGLDFDALWVGGLHDQAWPRPLRPNPLLPLSVQRRCGMPRASGSVELEFARMKTGQLAAAADDVIFSWAVQDTDEALRPSALIKGYPATDAEAPEPSAWARRQLADSITESVADYRLRSWPTGAYVRGGTWVIRAQSACAFQAQASYRLDAGQLQSPRPGITPRQRGSIAHLALQRLWEAWGSQADMLALSASERDRQIRAAVERAARDRIRQLSLPDRRLLTLECERLSERIGQLLDMDASRPPFRIATVETERNQVIGGVGLRMRADRVDQLSDGGLLILDYKTGKTRVGDWLRPRAKEPQLPLYALDPRIDAVGVAYGSMAVDKIGYEGLAGEAIAGTDIVEAGTHKQVVAEGADSWDDLVALWRERLTTIAGEFAAGHADVQPRDAEVCRYCHLAVLCRRHELRALGVTIDV